MKLQRSLPGLRLISPVSALTIPMTVLQQNSHLSAASMIAEMTDGAAFVGTV